MGKLRYALKVQFIYMNPFLDNFSFKNHVLAIYEHATEPGCPCAFISLRNKMDDFFLMAK